MRTLREIAIWALIVALVFIVLYNMFGAPLHHITEGWN